MLLTITTELPPATDLGHLLRKHPDRVQTFGQSFGTAHVFYPEASAERCTAALLLEVDPAALRRARAPAGGGMSLASYVNDRPYTASSLLSVAIGDVFRSALRGGSAERPDLAARPIPLTLTLPSVPCRGGAEEARALFEPLGWAVDAAPVPVDPELPDWGDSRYLSLTLTGEQRLADALSHLYVLLPVMDRAKHYWVASDEVDKLVRAAGGWLGAHPLRRTISRRYLAQRRALAQAALAQLSEAEGPVAETGDEPDDPAVEQPAPGPDGERVHRAKARGDADEAVGALSRDGAHEAAGADAAASPSGVPADAASGTAEAADGAPADAAEPPSAPSSSDAAPNPPAEERQPPLAAQRAEAVAAALRAEGSSTVLDLGCGTGSLVARLLRDPFFQRVSGADAAPGTVLRARRRLRTDRMGEAQARRVALFTASAVYRDARFKGHDAIVLMEVVEHVDPARLPALEDAVFGAAAPQAVVVTTPNVEYNVHYAGLPEGSLRHGDHRFEWTRAEFADWADRVAAAHGYSVRYVSVGTDDPQTGPPTQMGVFTR